MSEILNQVIGQAGPTLALARQALGGNGNGAAPKEPAPAAPEPPAKPARKPPGAG